MSVEKPKPELSNEETMLQEAVEAIREEKFTHARDLLTKLLQTDQKNPDYWVWMSAAMETQKERLYCLQTAYKLDPTNTAARRGLIVQGSLPQGAPPQPFPMHHPRQWEAKLKQAQEKPINTVRPAIKLAAVIGLIVFALVGTFIGVSVFSTPLAIATQAPIGTPRPTVTPYATNSNKAASQISTARPLADLLSSPYTPTPIYAATPHGDIAGDSYRGAMRAYNNGQWELVGIMMAQVATAQPGSVDALYFIGESKRLSGRYEEAIEDYMAAIQVNTRFAPTYLGMARAYLAMDPQKNVLVNLNKAIEYDSNYAEAYMQRGLYFFDNKDFITAKTDLLKAASLVNSPLVELHLARILLALQENEAALESAIRANKMDVTLLEGYLVLGMAYHANNDTEKAAEVLGTYLQYLPDNAEAFAILGAANYKRGEYNLAEENLLQSLSLNKINRDGYYWLGQTYIALKDNDKAVINFLKARDLDQESFDIAEGLADAYIAKSEYNNSYIAIIKAEKSVENPEQRARFLYIRALSLEQLSQPEAAYRDWGEILKLPVTATTEDMRVIAERRLMELRTVTPTITPTRTAEPTLPLGTLRPSRTPRPTDTRVPTSTPRGTALPPGSASPTP